MPKVINSQNFSREPRYRKLIIPYQKDHVLLECDQSQAEARVVAWKARESRLKDLFKRGEKVHEFVGSIIMQHPVTKKENKEEYELSKRIVHLTHYLGKPPMIAEVILEELGKVVPIHLCRRYQNIYLQNFPRIKTGYHMGIEMELKRNNNIIRTPVGDERKFYTPWGNDLVKQACAHYAQNVVVFITNQAMIRLHDTWMKDGLVLQAHDSLLYSVPKVRLIEANKILTKALTYTVVIEGEPLTIPVESKVGPNWGSMEDYNVS